MPRRRSRLSGQAEPICWLEIDYRFQEWLRLVVEFIRLAEGLIVNVE
jgi:hypothetical protein